MRLDSNGNMMWESDYGNDSTSYICRARSILETPDGGYIICALAPSEALWGAALVFKLDTLGNILWERWFGGENLPVLIWQVESTADGGCVLAGMVVDLEKERTHALVVRLDRNGRLPDSCNLTSSGSNLARSSHQSLLLDFPTNGVPVDTSVTPLNVPPREGPINITQGNLCEPDGWYALKQPIDADRKILEGVGACAVPSRLARLGEGDVARYLSEHPITSRVWKRFELASSASQEMITSAFDNLKELDLIVDYSFSRGPFGRSLGVSATTATGACYLRDPDLEEIDANYTGMAKTEGFVWSQNLFVALYEKRDIRVERIVTDEPYVEVEYSWTAGDKMGIFDILSPLMPEWASEKPKGRQTAQAFFVKTHTGWEIEMAW